MLKPLQRVDDEQPENVERHRSDRVLRPAHLPLRIDAADPVEHALDRRAQRVEDRRLAFVYARHVRAERLRQRDQDDDVEDELQISVRGHSNHSGLSIAATR